MFDHNHFGRPTDIPSSCVSSSKKQNTYAHGSQYVLYAYFGMFIHVGITIEPTIKDYWGGLNTHGNLIPEYGHQI